MKEYKIVIPERVESLFHCEFLWRAKKLNATSQFKHDSDRMIITETYNNTTQAPLNTEPPTDPFEPGDFSFIRDPMWRMFLHDAYQAVWLADAWSSLRDESPPDDKGFMFSSSPTTDTIQKFMRHHHDHSGASYGITMRSMESIAKRGWLTFVSENLDSQNTH